MDRRVKERLVGASILVVLIILIVPELLSGPAPAPAPAAAPMLSAPASATEQVRNVTVDLATRKAPAPEPPPAPEPAAASSPAPQDAPGTAVAESAPAALESAPPAPTSAAAASKLPAIGHPWSVQLGSFASRANADKLVHQLKAQGFAVYVLPGGTGAALRYRVRVGPMADRNAAAAAVAKLNSLGHSGTLVPPGP